MRVLPEPITSEWDAGNIDKNLNKHNVSIQEAEEVFFNEPLIIADDPKHSSWSERRFYALGQTRAHRQLFVAFTLRARKIRVISIRDMKKKERNVYE